ncbi:MAG: Ig-like domain-containing protein [Acinetobacter populi]|jgi:hypothetical protein|uniref:hypothetical protein n=1 Tax=Acinetobacter populi TaxID=1582270 RepID=UPI0023522990|nr:hypothetical protein [Acinetobacter populi]MCH4246740.1 Ig-like domain-containing protein [Acinetobacter populi]
MIDSNILKITALAASLALAGCGGGGGYYGDNSSTSTDSSSTSSSVNVSSITLTDSSGKLVTTVSTPGVTATVTVKNASGAPISGAIVTFSGDNMTFSTTNGSVVTNVDGVATIGITPTDSTVTGAYVLTASASYDGTTNTNTANVEFSKTDIVISNLTLASSTLESGGSTLLSLVTNDTDGNYQNGQTVNFTTTCGSFSDASLVSSSEGNVATTYYAYDAEGKLCSGSQTITATPVTSTSNTQTASVTIETATATSIVYTTTDEIKLAIKGSGSSSTGQIEFTVYSNGTALANQDVTLSIKNAPRGFSFITDGNTANKIVKSNSAGKVIVNLYPGNTPGPVEVEATLTSGFSALSKNVTITTGRATQNSFSLSVSKNSLQTDIDGDTATITAMLADRNGNSVPDGTVVNFVTEGGKVDGSCSTSDGQCSVTIRTQNPRPADGRVSVLAYVEGDKSYTDVNGDNTYTIGTDKLTSNIGSFFRDDNENNTYDSANGEFKYDRVLLGNSQDCAASTFTQPNIAGTCDDQLAAILRRQVVIYFASSTATIPDASASGSLLSFNLYGNSSLTIPMPSGTTVAVTPTDGTSSNNLTCSAELSSGSTPVANIASSTYYAYKLTGCAVGDSFKITVTAPNGKISNEYVNYK